MAASADAVASPPFSVADAVASPPFEARRARRHLCKTVGTAGCSVCVVGLALLVSIMNPVGQGPALRGFQRLDSGLVDGASKGSHKQQQQQKRDKHKPANVEPKRESEKDKRKQQNADAAAQQNADASGPPAVDGVPPVAIVPEDVAPFLIVLLVNASILLFTLVGTFSVTPGRWHAMSFVTSALYLAGLFAFLNEWDLSSTLEVLVRAAGACCTTLLVLSNLLLQACLPVLQRLPLSSLWFQIPSVFVLLGFSWSRAHYAVAEMRSEVRLARSEVDAAAADARDLRLRLDRCSGTPSALHGLSPIELETLESAASKSLTRIREALEERRKRANEQFKEEMEARLRCAVCMEAPKEVTFQCGHRFCVQCSNKVETCPQCRTLITLRIRSYD